MRKADQTSRNGFTLVEIIVVITLIWIFTLGVTNLDLSRLSIRQEQEILTNKVIGTIETIRNFGFQGKGIWASVQPPDVWIIEISDNVSGNILTRYAGTSGTGTYTPQSYSIDNWSEIRDIQCTNIDKSTYELLSWTGTITVSWDTMTLGWCTDTTLKILNITVARGPYESIIEINTINNVIQKL